MGMAVGFGVSDAKVATVKGKREKSAGAARASRLRASGPKKLKRLRYNFKEISSQILMAKTSGIAGMVAVRARSVLASLHRKKSIGEYDETELRHAIIHAGKMLRIAKKRTRHLKEEEKAEQKGSCMVEKEEFEDAHTKRQEQADEQLRQMEEELRKLEEEFQDLMEDSMREMMESMEEIGGLEEEMMGVVRVEMSPEALERLKKKHRADELREIVEADMKYLKALMGRLEREKQAGESGISLQLSGVDVPVSTTSPDMSVTADAADVPVMAEGQSVDISL